MRVIDPHSRSSRLAMFAVTTSSSAPAGAADECRGLEVCLPVQGPWVVVPPSGVVHWDLRCPRRGYIVAGTDARVSDRGVDVWFRAETGSPVGPGRSSTGSAYFTARYAGATARRVGLQAVRRLHSDTGWRVARSDRRRPDPASAARGRVDPCPAGTDRCRCRRAVRRGATASTQRTQSDSSDVASQAPSSWTT